MKKVILLLVMVMFSSTAFAFEGKVVSVADGKVKVELKDAKFKKGNSVKINGKQGKVTAVDGSVVTVKASKSLELKAGDTVKVDKAADMQGC